MYWLDAVEEPKTGVVYVFGKVKGQADGDQLVSCCVSVHGIERNLFVLPRALPDRFNADGSQQRRLVDLSSSTLTLIHHTQSTTL
jgi:DNA polymerase alpha subunit A